MKAIHSPATGTLSVIACTVFAAALIAFAAGCASTKQTEDLLTAAGFKPRPATTAAQQAHLKSLPAHKVSLLRKEGKTYYVFPDTTKNVLYVGDSAQYEEYQKLRKQQQWAEEQANPAVEMLNESALWGW